MTLPTVFVLLSSLGGPRAEEAPPTHHAPAPGEDPALEEPALVGPAQARPAPTAVGEPPGLSGEERFEALMRFRHDHLDLRGTTRWSGGGATVIHGGWGWGWGPHWGWGWGWSPSVVIRDPLEPQHDWAVFQGVQRLTVPAYLDEVGDQLRLAALEQDLRRTHRRQVVGYGVGGTGMAATVVSFVAAAWSETEGELMLWNTVATGGLCAALVGTMVGSSAASRGRRLQTDFPHTVSYDDTQAQVDAYNERLREELGLTRADAYEVITERPPRRER
jgi:hypothetical protein